MGKRAGFIGGLLAVFFLSIIVFFVFYFLMPEVSEKFFGFSMHKSYSEVGTSLTSNEDINNAISSFASGGADSLVMTSKEATIAINDYLKSDEGQATTVAIQNAARDAGVSVADFLKSEKAQSLFDSAKTYVSTGVGSVNDFFTNGEGKTLLEGISK